MEPKKVIAICQSRGNFELGDDGLLSYNGGEAYAVDLNNQTQLSDFKQEVAETFKYSADDMLIKYFLPGNRKTLITISKDKDLQRMVNFYRNFDQVEVFILTEEFAARNVLNMPTSRSSMATISEAIILQDAPGPLYIAPPDEIIDIEMDTSDKSFPVVTPTNTNDEKQRRAAMQWENTITGVDQRFSSFIEFREALHKYSIAHGFTYKYKKNDSHRVTVKCKLEGCPWRIYASRLATTQLICIKKMSSTHTCEGAAVKAGYRATRGWVGNIIKEKLKLSPNYKPRDIADDMKRDYGIQLNYSQAWRAKEIAREQLQGSYKEAFNQLPFFCQSLLETNPGSLAKFTTKEDSSFHRLFVSLHASISGFQQGCRPLLFLDSIPLNSKYQGMLLTATAVDGNDGIFPVAFAVVDDGTDDSWQWFLVELKSAVPASQPITFIADSRKSLRGSLHEIFGEECHHAYCMRYLTEKLNKDLKEQFSHEARRIIVQDFHAAAYAPNIEAFERCAESVKAISPEAYNWVVRSEPEHWANALFCGARYNHMTSNYGQLFYSWVSDANELPITQMVDTLLGKLVDLFYTKRVDSAKWETRLTPYMEEKLNNEISKALSFHVSLIHDTTFEVRGESLDIVDIDHWNCSCKGWQITGLPCCHAIAVIHCLGKSPYEYCSRYFTVDNYCLTYAESVHPVPGVEKPLSSEVNEVATIISPPPIKRAPGRPKMKQAAAPEIIKRQLQCSNCKGLGHNKKTCSKVSKVSKDDEEPLDPLLLSNGRISES